METSRLGGLVVAPAKTPIARTLRLIVLEPNKARVKDFESDWAKAAAAGALANVDDSVANVSSIVVMAVVSGKTMLLRGDDRGDDKLAGSPTRGCSALLHKYT